MYTVRLESPGPNAIVSLPSTSSDLSNSHQAGYSQVATYNKLQTNRKEHQAAGLHLLGILTRGSLSAHPSLPPPGILFPFAQTHAAGMRSKHTDSTWQCIRLVLQTPTRWGLFCPHTYKKS